MCEFMDIHFLQLISLIILMLQLSQIWPMEALSRWFLCLFDVSPSFLSTCILSGIYSRLILYFPTPAICMPSFCLDSYTSHQPNPHVRTPSLPCWASSTPCQAAVLHGYISNFAQILISCVGIPLIWSGPNTPGCPLMQTNSSFHLDSEHPHWLTILYKCPPHPNVLYPKQDHPSTLSHPGSNTLCLTTTSHPGWLLHPMQGTLPPQDTLLCRHQWNLLWGTGVSYHAVWMHTLLGITHWFLNWFFSGRERKGRGSRRGKDEEEEKPILLETCSSQTFAPQPHQNPFCQGSKDCHRDQFSVFIQQSSHSPAPDTLSPVQVENTHSPGLPFTSLEIPV